MCQYTCDEGYQLSDPESSVLTCKGKDWSGKEPACVGKLVNDSLIISLAFCTKIKMIISRTITDTHPKLKNLGVLGSIHVTDSGF